jgi:hypothetical protein
VLKKILEGLSAFLTPKAVPQLGRNEPCHCGSGRKYKRCCLEKDADRLRSEREFAPAAGGNSIGGRPTVANKSLQRADEHRPSNEYRPPRSK